MHYTDEQFNALAPYEENFRSAVSHNYVPKNPGSKVLDAIREAYMTATGVRHYVKNWGCGACVVTLFKDAGRLWLADKDARDAAAIEAANDKAAAKTIEDAQKAPDLAAKDEGGKTPAKTAKAPKTAPKSTKPAKK